MSTLELTQLVKLGPETWGDRLARARQAAGHNLRSIEAVFHGQPLGLSRATINRLEKLASEPTGGKDRQRAFILLVVYGFDPRDFGLKKADAPSVIDFNALRDLGFSASGWLFPNHPSGQHAA